MTQIYPQPDSPLGFIDDVYRYLKAKGVTTTWGAQALAEALAEALYKVPTRYPLKPDWHVVSDADFIMEGLKRGFAVMALPQVDVDKLFAAIEHGDDAHRAWLKDKLQEFFTT